MGASVEPKIMPGQSVFFRSFKWERFYLLYAKTVPELKGPVALFGRLWTVIAGRGFSQPHLVFHHNKVGGICSDILGNTYTMNGRIKWYRSCYYCNTECSPPFEGKRIKVRITR